MRSAVSEGGRGAPKEDNVAEGVRSVRPLDISPDTLLTIDRHDPMTTGLHATELALLFVES